MTLPAPAGRDHVREHRLHHEEHALDVHGEQPVVHRFVALQQRRQVEDGGVVEQHVDGAEALRCAVDQRVERVDAVTSPLT